MTADSPTGNAGALEAWTCRVCGAAFQARPDQVAQRMAHHVENHMVTMGKTAE